GLYQWRIERDEGPTNALRLGPRVAIGSGSSNLAFCDLSRDARLVVAEAPQGALLVGLQNPSTPPVLLPHSFIVAAAISPEGQYVATASSESSALKIWDVAGRRVLKEIPASGDPSALFSPDGRWLATGGENYRVYGLYRVGS